MAAHVTGVGMTKFDRHPDRSLSDLGGEAIDEALADADCDREDVDLAVVGNSAAGVITGQTSIRGQVVLKDNDLGGFPIVNVENACASGSTALHVAQLEAMDPAVDTVLALGVEKLFVEDDRSKTFEALAGAMGGNVSRLPDGGESDDGGSGRSVFMDLYATIARGYMNQHGATQEHFAKVASKNRSNAAKNPKAQFQEPATVAEVLESRTIVDPLTLYMCSPVGDGAAAAVVTDEPADRSVEVASSALVSGRIDASEPEAAERAATVAYERAGIDPAAVDIAEVHDATSPGEVIAYETLGLCEEGEGWQLVEDGETEIDGGIPVNTSGGLVCKGHPVGATGLAQVHEVVTQLRGEAGDRQVANPQVGVTHNGGGFQGVDAGAYAAHVLRAR